MKDLLRQIAHEQVAAAETAQGPAAPQDIDALAEAVENEMSAKLPHDIRVYLSHSNGTDFNGLLLYGAYQSIDKPGPGGFWQGLIAANREWRETGDHSTYVILGETGIDLLTVDLQGQNAVSRDRMSGDQIESFPTVAAMLETYLLQHILA
ncbi:YrhA family protein [uncultured Tateyamaria sp.]|uniref:YrhA family protein n=1 Tax=uncultured Tateyamaria sp. TaxID=455651 RepID=UPI0026397744|nr:YrhA family protein [uncultured Tateyamaria sp.]